MTVPTGAAGGVSSAGGSAVSALGGRRSRLTNTTPSDSAPGPPLAAVPNASGDVLGSAHRAAIEAPPWRSRVSALPVA